MCLPLTFYEGWSHDVYGSDQPHVVYGSGNLVRFGKFLEVRDKAWPRRYWAHRRCETEEQDTLGALYGAPHTQTLTQTALGNLGRDYIVFLLSEQ